MKPLIVALFISFTALHSTTQAQTPPVNEVTAEAITGKFFNPAHVLWYTKPAAVWEDALPVGNGRLGAMVFGGVKEERIQLNEETYWTGGPYSTVVKGGHEALPEIQRLIFAGKPIEAHKLFGRKLMGYPVEQQKYQSLANLHLFYDKEADATDYKRWLDLGSGVSGVQYEIDGVRFTREVLASAVDQTIAIRLTASEPGKLNFEAELRGVRNEAHSNYGTDYFRMDVEGNDELVLRGKSADYLGIEGRLRFEARVKVKTEGGSTTVKGTRIKIQDANAVTLYFVAATNFVNYQDVSGDEKQKVKNALNSLDGKKYEGIKEAAVQDYRQFLNRVQLTMPGTENSHLPTDERLKKIETAPDPPLAALIYQFGRYLLISSSRVGTQPANLQGIWNKDMNPSWDSKYTTNINLEMNYWAVESANLSELSAPLFKMITELTDQGSQVAKEHYGASGWVFHQNTDLWRVAAPMDGPTWGTFTVGGAWLVTHLWEHYLYTKDKAFLKEMYPVLKGSVDFFMDFLVEHPNEKWLVTNPSNSPENPPQGPGYEYFFDEVTGSYYFTTITAGSTMDMQILKDLFSYYATAAEILDVDKDYAAKVTAARSRLVPSQIGKNGNLQEWADDLAQMEDKHRHFSHLYGLYPGNVLSAKYTPELVNGIKSVLEQRGDGGTGWSRAWKTALWARLGDGERAHSIYKGYLKDQCYMSLFAKCYTPLQVDGSLGMTAAITEMLVQSHEDAIVLLPALPEAWATGSFNGVCVRGAFELDYAWKKGKVVSVSVQSKAGSLCRIKTGTSLKPTLNGKKVKFVSAEDGVIEFQTVKGGTYVLK